MSEDESLLFYRFVLQFRLFTLPFIFLFSHSFGCLLLQADSHTGRTETKCNMKRIFILILLIQAMVAVSCQKYMPMDGENSGKFVDSRDDHEYQWVRIGKQIWMAENLAFLPAVSPADSGSSTRMYYYVYDFAGTSIDSAKATDNYTTSGVLYNWPAAMSGALPSMAIPSGVKGVCPEGWHLPSDEEWKILEFELGMSESDLHDDGVRESGSVGKQLKEAGLLNHWDTFTFAKISNNSSGFTAHPAGWREYFGSFWDINEDAYFWSSSSVQYDFAWLRNLGYLSNGVFRFSYYMSSGASVRCLKNE
jgi:uncharacterized protein (TIGR02145 family)